MLFVLLFVQLASACAAWSFSVVVAAFLFLLVLLFLLCVLLSCFCCRFLVRRPLKNPPLPFLTFQNVCTVFVAFGVLFVCHFLLLLDAGFSCCVLFFLLFVLLLLPLLRLLLFMALLLLLLLPVLLLLLLLLLCCCCCCGCFQVADR